MWVDTGEGPFRSRTLAEDFRSAEVGARESRVRRTEDGWIVETNDTDAEGKPMYRVRSKSTGSYFGKYLSRKAAMIDAADARECRKAGLPDWVAEPIAFQRQPRKPGEKDPAVSIAKGAINEALRQLSKPVPDKATAIQKLGEALRSLRS